MTLLLFEAVEGLDAAIDPFRIAFDFKLSNAVFDRREARQKLVDEWHGNPGRLRKILRIRYPRLRVAVGGIVQSHNAVLSGSMP